MPSPSTSDLPIPRSWEEFEDIVSDIYRERWGDPYVQRFGRSGQAQDGIDIFGRPQHLGGAFAAIQCKKRDTLTVDDVLSEAERAKRFLPSISEFVFATTAKRDAKLQRDIWNARDGFPFRVEIVFWEDLCLALSGSPNLLQKYFPAWAKATMTTNRILEILAQAPATDFHFADSPPQYLYLKDVDLRLAEEVQSKPESFKEPWLDCFLSRDHFAKQFHLWYRNSRIDTFYFVNADGGRIYIPYPFPTLDEGRRISPLQYNIARIINDQHRGSDIDCALTRCGIAVDPALGNWPAHSTPDN